MPFVIRWPGKIKPNSRPTALIQNIDYAPTFLDIAGAKTPAEVQGQSIVPVLNDSSKQLRDALYYAYYELGEHAVPQHFGIRTHTHKLFYLPGTDEWQMFDLVKDPQEMNNLYGQPQVAAVEKQLHLRYDELRSQYKAPTYAAYAPRRSKK